MLVQDRQVETVEGRKVRQELFTVVVVQVEETLMEERELLAPF